MCDHSFAVAAAFKACGVEAEVIPESDEETLYWGRKLTSGKECYPCIVTTGDMVKLVKDPNFDHERAAFFMPSGNGPCRFGQYHRFHRLVLDDLGFHHVPIYSPNQDETLYSDLGIMGSRFTRLAWQGIVAVDLLMKKLLETRPYEKEKGKTDQVYQESLKRVCEAILQGRRFGGSPSKEHRGFQSDRSGWTRNEASDRDCGRDLCPPQSVQQ